MGKDNQNKSKKKPRRVNLEDKRAKEQNRRRLPCPKYCTYNKGLKEENAWPAYSKLAPYDGIGPLGLRVKTRGIPDYLDHQIKASSQPSRLPLFVETLLQLGPERRHGHTRELTRFAMPDLIMVKYKCYKQETSKS